MRHSLQASGIVYDIKDCLVRGRRPVVMDHVNSVDTAWYKDTMKCALLETRVLSGVLHRLCHKELGEAFIAEEVNKQRMPSRAGFNAILYPEIPRVSNIGYCPMIAGSTNDFSTILTVLKHAQKISATMSQADTVITFDLAIYRKAEEIQWRFPDEYFSVVARMSGFHIALNFLSLLGKKNTWILDLKTNWLNQAYTILVRRPLSGRENLTTEELGHTSFF